MYKKLKWADILDMFIQHRVSEFSSLTGVIEDPDFGEDDEWFFKAIHEYIYKLSSDQFLDLLEEITLKIKEKYTEYLNQSNLGREVFSIIEEMIDRRPTRYHFNKYPDSIVPLDLTDAQEKRFIEIILKLKNDLPDAHKYRAYVLIEEMTGKWLGKEDPYAP